MVQHRKLLLPCGFLPVDNSYQKKSKTQSEGKRDTRQVDTVTEKDSEDENDWRGLKTLPIKQLAESTSQLKLEEDELQLGGMSRDLNQELNDDVMEGTETQKS